MKRAPLCAHGSALAAHCTTAARQGYGSWPYRKAQPSVSQSCPLESVPTGAPWRHLHASFGNGNSQFRRFRRWAASSLLQWVFEALRGDPDLEYVPIDGAIVPVHQQAAGAKGVLGTSAWAAPAAD